MPRVRKETKSGFVVMSNDAFQDPNLSNKARGLLATMMTLPQDWQYSIEGLAVICKKDGRDTIRKQIKELESAGYLVKGRIRDEYGRLVSSKYYVFDTPWWNMPEDRLPEGFVKPTTDNPTSEKPKLENPTLDNPALGKPTQLNKQLSIKQKSNTQESNILSIYLDRMDRMGIERTIKENIDFDILCSYEDKERLQEIVGIMVDTLCSSKETIRINNEDIPYEVVAERFGSIDSEHIIYALDCMDNRSGDIRNLRAYILTTLFNAPLTIQNYNTTLYERNRRKDEN